MPKYFAIHRRVSDKSPAEDSEGKGTVITTAEVVCFYFFFSFSNTRVS